MLLLDAWRRAKRIGASTEALEVLLEGDPFLVDAPSPWPPAEVVFVGAELASALRPYARDLAQQLAPPGSDDAVIEASAERLAASDAALFQERITQEQRCGIEWHQDGRMVVAAKRLPRDGLCRLLRSRWTSRKAPESIACFHSVEQAMSRPLSLATKALFLLDPTAPPRHPSALVCPQVSARLALHGEGNPRLIDRSQEHPYRLWAWIEPLVDEGATVTMDSRRDALLSSFLGACF